MANPIWVILIVSIVVAVGVGLGVGIGTMGPMPETRPITSSTTAAPTPQATPGTPFTIDVVNTEATLDSAVAYAKASWESVLGPAPFGPAVLPAGTWCNGLVVTTEPQFITHLRIHVFIASIDGPGGIVAQAGPCAVDSQGFPRVGIVYLDTADMAPSASVMGDVVRHEIGHVLGLGTLWQAGVTYGFTATLQGYPYLLPWANLALGGTARVEHQGGEGTAGAHWHEGVHGAELMTGYLGPGLSMPLSSMTVGALRDLGYATRPENAEGRRRLRSSVGSTVRLMGCTGLLGVPISI